MMTMGRHKKRKKTSHKMTGQQKMTHRNVTLKFMNITGMMKNMNKTRRALKLKEEDKENEKIERSSHQNKPKEITLEKNDQRERNIGETNLKTSQQTVKKR